MIHCKFDLDELIARAGRTGLEVDKEHMEEVLDERPEIGGITDKFGRTLTHALTARGILSPEEAYDLPGSQIESLDGFTPVENAQVASAVDLADAVA